MGVGVKCSAGQVVLGSFHANSPRDPLLTISNSFYFLPMCNHEKNTKSYKILGQNSNYF